MTKEEALKEASCIMDTSKKALVDVGKIFPTVFFHTEDGTHIFFIDNEFMANPVKKDMLALLLKMEAKARKADAGFFVSEVWATLVRKEDVEKYGVPVPSEIPERREAIVITYEYKDGKDIGRGAQMQYFHKEGEKVVFGEYEEKETDFESRFSFFSDGSRGLKCDLLNPFHDGGMSCSS